MTNEHVSNGVEQIAGTWGLGYAERLAVLETEAAPALKVEGHRRSTNDTFQTVEQIAGTWGLGYAERLAVLETDAQLGDAKRQHVSA